MNLEAVIWAQGKHTSMMLSRLHLLDPATRMRTSLRGHRHQSHQGHSMTSQQVRALWVKPVPLEKKREALATRIPYYPNHFWKVQNTSQDLQQATISRATSVVHSESIRHIQWWKTNPSVQLTLIIRLQLEMMRDTYTRKQLKPLMVASRSPPAINKDSKIKVFSLSQFAFWK